MATSVVRSSTKRTPIGKSSTSGEDSSSSKDSRHRRYRSLSRFSHRMPDIGAEETPGRRGTFVNTVRGSGFPEISLDDLAIDFFDSFSASRDARSSSRKTDVSDRNTGGEASVSQRRGRSVSRQGSKSGFDGGGGGRRLDADTESSRRRRSVSRQPSRGPGTNGARVGRLGSETESSRRRRSASRPTTRGSGADSGRAGRLGLESGDLRRRRSLSVTPFHISDSESDLDHFQRSSNQANMKSCIRGNSQVPGPRKLGAPEYRPGLGRSFSQRDLKYNDDHSSQSSGLTDDDGRETYSNRSVIERVIRAVQAQNKIVHPTGDDLAGGLYGAMRKELCLAVEQLRMEIGQGTPKPKNSLVDNGFGSQPKTSDFISAVSTLRKLCGQQSERLKEDLLAEILLEEQRGAKPSRTLKKLVIDNNSAVTKKPTRDRKRSSDRGRMSKCLTDEAEKYIEEFISNIEDTDFSSLDDERSETSSNFGVVKHEVLQSPPVPKSIPVETDGVMLPWLQWETTSDPSPMSWTNKALAGNSFSSRGSWSPGDSAAKSVEHPSCRSQLQVDGATGKLKIDIDDYLQRESTEEFLYHSWTNRNRISTGSLMLCHGRFF